MQLALIRHARTGWNETARLQGRHDIALSDTGRDELARWRLPSRFADFQVRSSPLGRACDTAEALAPGQVRIEPQLIEMDYGAWEGHSLDDLRAELGDAFQAEADRGLDFTPPGGESPRAVQARLRPLLERWARGGDDILAVTHKGVIRAILGLAAGWDFMGKPPARLAWDRAHLFVLTAEGMPHLVEPNIPLVAS